MLQIKDLEIEYIQRKRKIPAVRGVSFEVLGATSVGIVGESGCGKSSIARAIVKLISPHEGRIKGEILYEQKDILKFNEKQLQQLRGKEIGMIFQDPFNSLNPLMTVEEQLHECIANNKHITSTNKEIYNKILELLEQVKIPDAERIAHSYPHQLSGGLLQRVMIAIAISQIPNFLIADEPTTALDVTIQKDILQLLSDLRGHLCMSLILITHNLALVANHAVKTIVMYAGKIMEEATTRQLFKHPKHPYTQALISALPSLNSTKPLQSIPGHPPSFGQIPHGCPFNNRCSLAHKKCFEIEPSLIAYEGRKVSCHLYE